MNDRNLKTAQQFERLEAGELWPRPLRGRDYIRAMGRRLIYLHEKDASLPPHAGQQNYLMQEIDAIFWLLAHYAKTTGDDLRPHLIVLKGHERIDFERLEVFLKKADGGPAGNESTA